MVKVQSKTQLNHFFHCLFYFFIGKADKKWTGYLENNIRIIEFLMQKKCRMNKKKKRQGRVG